MAFWFVLHVVAEPLVKQTTRQAASDYARSVIAWQHVDRRKPGDVEPVYPIAIRISYLISWPFCVMT
ncbi:MAG: hypothetical protein R3C56_39615 [Pirellulaceae bacterium]